MSLKVYAIFGTPEVVFQEFWLLKFKLGIFERFLCGTAKMCSKDHSRRKQTFIFKSYGLANSPVFRLVQIFYLLYLFKSEAVTPSCMMSGFNSFFLENEEFLILAKCLRQQFWRQILESDTEVFRFEASFSLNSHFISQGRRIEASVRQIIYFCILSTVIVIIARNFFPFQALGFC